MDPELSVEFTLNVNDANPWLAGGVTLIEDEQLSEGGSTTAARADSSTHTHYLLSTNKQHTDVHDGNLEIA